MRILHIFDHTLPLHSGYTFRSLAILRHQQALGWETAHLSSPKQGPVAATQETVDGCLFYRTAVPNGMLSRLPILNQWAIVDALANRLTEVIDQVRPDILHAHSPSLNGLAALRAARRYNIPLVYEVRAFWEDAAVDHGTCREGDWRYRTTRALETYVLKRAAAITCICEGLRYDIVDRGIPDAKITVIPNAVDVTAFSTGGVPDAVFQVELGLVNKQVVGFIGSFYAYEGLTLLLDAIALLQQAWPDLRVLLVGGGPEEARLREQVQKKNLTQRVIFTGRVPHDQIHKYYDLVDIFSYPRLPMRLTELVTPLKPLEAMAQGKLVLASDVGGHRELITQDQTGVLFRAGDVAALAKALSSLLARREDWPRLQAAGRHFVETERHWRASVSRYRQVYERLLPQSTKTHA